MKHEAARRCSRCGTAAEFRSGPVDQVVDGYLIADICGDAAHQTAARRDTSCVTAVQCQLRSKSEQVVPVRAAQDSTGADRSAHRRPTQDLGTYPGVVHAAAAVYHRTAVGAPADRQASTGAQSAVEESSGTGRPGGRRVLLVPLDVGKWPRDRGRDDDLLYRSFIKRLAKPYVDTEG